MSWLTRTCIRAGAARAHARLAAAAGDPESAQRRVLGEIAAANADTAFGRAHSFSSIDSPGAYARRVPVRDYEQHRPWVDRIVSGESGVLTAEPVLSFAQTSGTTAQPKLVPVTPSCLRQLRELLRVWIHGCSGDHPGMFRGAVATFTDLPVEGHTDRGAPIGAVSGMTSARVPWVIRRHAALPPQLAAVGDYGLRYTVAARLALARSISTLATPNPTTLLRLAEIIKARSDAIVRAIRDGQLGVGASAEAEAKLQATLGIRPRPDPRRAAELEALMAEHGTLLPQHAWPELAVIGCWLGGSAGVLSRRLATWYGDTPKRDLGYRATEATITVPVSDETDAGVLALGSNFYEFLPVDAGAAARPLLAHELREGERYQILLTTRGGLYRYDICDVVEVRGWYRESPLIAFVHKGRDMVNITGEKLHAMQIARAAEHASETSGVRHVQLQVVPDVEACCYDVLLELGTDAPTPLWAWAEAFDAALSAANIEYRGKRRSGRLDACRVWQMRVGWSERRRRADIELRGRRDTQYKWPLIRLELDDDTRAEMLDSRAEMLDPGELAAGGAA